MATRFDPERRVTEVYAVDTGANTGLVRHEIDSLLNEMTIPLPLAWGVPWVAEDLDLDGQIELVVQRGDGAGTGYLDIHSSPDWILRRRFVYPGLTTVMNPVTVNIDADPYLELYVTPNSDVVGRAVIIKYDADSGNFVAASDIPAPYGAAGHPAVADFDGDGRMEFVSGGSQGYMLYEWQDTALVYIGPVGRPPSGADFHASAVRPKPGGVVHLLLGHSGSMDGFLYELLEPVGDNVFDQVHVFQEITGLGIHPNSGSDSDCDGLDELVMLFAPSTKQWEWDEDSAGFVLGCTWSGWGTFQEYYPVDVNQDGVADMGTINHNFIFGVFSDSCDSCDSDGRCPFAGPWCACPCHGDPACDGVTDVLDVISAIDVAFRGALSPYAMKCPRDDADLDCNRATDVLDVVIMVDVAFRGAPATARICNPCSGEGPLFLRSQFDQEVARNVRGVGSDDYVGTLA